MGKDPLSPTRKKPLRGKPKTKTGCRTCKIRRVKCDEEKPCCRKCISTGRACDGYGIWGGGGNGFALPSSRSCMSPARCLSPVLGSGTLDREETLVFEWLLHRALKKLAGLFGSTFWETLVVQTSSTEPATLHALLALGSAHKADVLDHSEELKGTINEHDKFTLQQYNKAIQHLRVHYSSKNNNVSITVALIACMIFASLEILRRRYTASNVHLVHGLKLLTEVQSQTCSAEGQQLVLKSQPDSTHDYITEVFTRLNSQSVLFGLGSPQVQVELHYPEAQKFPLMFESIKQARQYLDSLLDKIHRLTEHTRLTASTSSPYSQPNLFYRQQRIESDLSAWLQTYNASLISLKCHLSTGEAFALPLLRLFHIMATVIVSTCLSPLDEMAFDSFTADFIQTVTFIAKMMNTLSSPAALKMVCQGQSSFTLDMGYNQPLYYMAMKCRHPRLRRLAVRCILAMPHREGFWDPKLIASACKEVIRLEEQRFYSELELDEDFDKCANLSESDITDGVATSLDVPVLPESYRIFDPRIMLPSDSTGEVRLAYKRKTETDGFQLFETTIDVF